MDMNFFEINLKHTLIGKGIYSKKNKTVIDPNRALLLKK